MASVTSEVDLPPDLTLTAYHRHADGHGFEGEGTETMRKGA
jgi:hypothetical protein